MFTISENCACLSVESSVSTKIWKEIKKTQLKTYLNIAYLSKILPFMKNYGKMTQQLYLCLSIWHFRLRNWTDSWHGHHGHSKQYQFRKLKLNYSCSLHLILFPTTSDEQSNIRQIWVKNNWPYTGSLNSDLLLVPTQISWFNLETVNKQTYKILVIDDAEYFSYGPA